MGHLHFKASFDKRSVLKIYSNPDPHKTHYNIGSKYKNHKQIRKSYYNRLKINLFYADVKYANDFFPKESIHRNENHCLQDKVFACLVYFSLFFLLVK